MPRKGLPGWLAKIAQGGGSQFKIRVQNTTDIQTGEDGRDTTTQYCRVTLDDWFTEAEIADMPPDAYKHIVDKVYKYLEDMGLNIPVGDKIVSRDGRDVIIKTESGYEMGVRHPQDRVVQQAKDPRAGLERFKPRPRPVMTGPAEVDAPADDGGGGRKTQNDQKKQRPTTMGGA